MKRVIEKLIEKRKTISTMESCTGGFVANEITNIEGASEVFKFGAVTYSNEYKIKLGVDAGVIETYSVYSMETAHEMSKNIVDFTSSDYGIGITGKLNRVDINNLAGEDNVVFACIYSKGENKFYEVTLRVEKASRAENKKMVCDALVEKLLEIIE